MRVNEVMSRNINCCVRTTSVMNAARMLRESDIGILVVVDDPETRRLTGVVTDRDLCLRALGELHDPTLTTVEDCMTWEPVYCTPDVDVQEVLAAMGEQQIRRIPVVDYEMKVLGLISLTDLIRHDAISPQDVYRALGRITAPSARARAQAA